MSARMDISRLHRIKILRRIHHVSIGATGISAIFLLFLRKSVFITLLKLIRLCVQNGEHYLPVEVDSEDEFWREIQTMLLQSTLGDWNFGT